MSDTEAHLYEIDSFGGRDDYLPDAALVQIAALVAKLPSDGFDCGHVNATAKGVTATLTFGGGDPMTNAATFEAMLQSVTVVRTLHANLAAARAALAKGEV